MSFASQFPPSIENRIVIKLRKNNDKWHSDASQMCHSNQNRSIASSNSSKENNNPFDDGESYSPDNSNSTHIDQFRGEIVTHDGEEETNQGTDEVNDREMETHYFDSPSSPILLTPLSDATEPMFRVDDTAASYVEETEIARLFERLLRINNRVMAERVGEILKRYYDPRVEDCGVDVIDLPDQYPQLISFDLGKLPLNCFLEIEDLMGTEKQKNLEKVSQ